MKIAPIDITHKSFNRRMMGFDQDEVMDFLRLVAEELEAVIRDRNNLRESIREKELAILEYRERDELLKSTITTATKMSDKIRQDAEREARLILNDAKQQSEMIVRDARDSLKKIFQEITDLKRIRMQYEGNLRALVQSNLTMIEHGHRAMPDPDVNGFFAAAGMNSNTGMIGAANASAQQQGAMTGSAANNAQAQETIRHNVAAAIKNSLRDLEIK